MKKIGKGEIGKLALSNDELFVVNESLQHEISLRKQTEKECERLSLVLQAKNAELENLSIPYPTISKVLY